MSEFDLTTVDRLLTTTRSVRKRLDLTRPVERKVVRECLDIALQAATGGNNQRWRWIVVTDAEKRRVLGATYARAFREILAKGYGGDDDAPGPEEDEDHEARFSSELIGQQRLISSVQHLIEHMGEVPVHIVPCAVGRPEALQSGGAGGDAPATTWVSSQYGSIYPAIWNLQLALRSRGLGSCITTAHLEYEREIAELLDIPFDEVMQICLLPVAYYTGTTFVPTERRPLDDVVFDDVFDRSSLAG